MNKQIDNVVFGWPAARGELRIAVIGVTGRIGGRGGQLIQTRHREWSALGVRPRIVFAASSRASCADAEGLQLTAHPAQLRDGAAWPDLGDLNVDVVIDCTSSVEIAERYAAWLAQGIHVVTPNKITSSADYTFQTEILGAQARTGARLRDS